MQLIIWLIYVANIIFESFFVAVKISFNCIFGGIFCVSDLISEWIIIYLVLFVAFGQYVLCRAQATQTEGRQVTINVHYISNKNLTKACNEFL